MAYGTVEGWEAYAGARGNTAPVRAGSDDSSAALERGSDYVRLRYVVPLGLDAESEEVIEAAYIAASLELETPGFWSKTFTTSQTKVLTQVEGIRWTPVETKGMGAVNDQQPISIQIEQLLRPHPLVGVTAF